MLLARSRKVLRHWNRLLSVFLIFVLVITVLLTPLLFLQNIQRFEDDPFSYSFRVRQEIWRISWRIFQDFRWTGAGLGTFPHLTRRYQHFQSSLVFVYTESDVLRFLAETGIIGSLLLVLAGGVFARRVVSLWRLRQSRWAVALVAGGFCAMVSLVLHGFGDFNLYIPANALVFTVIAALTYVAVYTRETRHHG
jgi:O-antigen ligase